MTVRGRLRPVVGVMVVSLLVALAAAPPAATELGSQFESAIGAARGASTCEPLRHDDVLDKAAEIVNRSTYSYLNYSAADVPADNPNPAAILADLGIKTDRALALQGAGRSPADAVKGALLQGYKAIPDCSYTTIGTSLVSEEQSGYVLVVAILVGR